MNRTAEFESTVVEIATQQGLPKEKLTKLRQAQILRSLATKSEFGRIARELLQNLECLQLYIKDNRRDYVQQGRLSEDERDRIEEEVSTYVRICSKNIDKLQASIQREQELNAADFNSSIVAFRQGVTLLLSERLQALTSSFDRCRSMRYQQLMNKTRSGSAITQALPQQHLRQVSPEELQRAVLAHNGGAVDGQQLQQLQLENQALQQDMLSRHEAVHSVERSMREVVALNQMFSTQILRQSEQIEQVYLQAVRATMNVEAGNVHLKKAIKLNSSARLYVFVIFLIATVTMLFLDWYSS